MFPRFLILGLSFALITIASPVAAQTPAATSDQSWIVVLESDTPAIQRARGLASVFGGEAELVFENVLNGFMFRGSQQAAQALERVPGVASVEPNREFRSVAELGTSGFLRIDADLTYAAGEQGLMSDGTAVRIAILDTGIMASHADLSPNLDLSQSVNCINPGSDPDDDQGHGTHVAGIAAAADQGAGIVGVASQTKIIVAKVLNSAGIGTDAQIICGLDYVASLAADGIPTVVNMSLGAVQTEGTGCASSALHQAICNLTDANVTVVAAAGNNTADGATFFPAAYPETIAVSAFTALDGTPASTGCQTFSDVGYQCDETLASFTNYGSVIDVTAPGVRVYSTTFGGSYGLDSGTSMAAPYVSGVAALILAADPTLTPDEVRLILQSSGECPDGSTAGGATCIASGQWQMSDGASATFPDPDGIAEPLINARAAVDAATPPPDLDPPSVSVDTPVNLSTVAAPILMSGVATDAVGVTQVALEIYDRETSMWWDGSAWQASRTSFDAALGLDSWSYSFDPGLPAVLPYWATVQAFDAAANASARSIVNFTIAGGDVTVPTVSVTTPTEGSTVTAPVSLAGTATDNVAVGSVGVEIYDRDTSMWWDGSVWRASRTSFNAVLGVDSWTYSFDPGSPATLPYWATVEAFDVAGNASGRGVVNFTIGVGDVTAPAVTVTSPGNNATVSAPVTLVGTATDAVGVTSVTLEIYDRDTSMWWNGSTWQAPRTSFDSSLGTGTWSYEFDPGAAATLPYWTTVQGFDAAGNASVRAMVNFTVETGDLEAPEVAVSSPVNNATEAAPVLLAGTAADNVAVAAVVVEIYDRDISMWWNGSIWQTARTSFDASLGAGTWSYSFDPGASATLPYWATVQGIDAAGNLSVRAIVNFVIA